MARPVVIRGRDHERRRLDDLCVRATSGHGGLVLVEGEAGIGKSRLALDLADHATSLGFAVHLGAAARLSGRPFGPLLEALGVERDADDAARRAVADLIDRPVHDRPLFAVGAGATSEAMVVDAIARLVRHLAEKTPVLLVVEDVHWAGQSTFLALGELARQATTARVVVLVTARTGADDEASRSIAALSQEAADAFRLGRVGDDAVREMVADLAGAPPVPALMQRARQAAGNPLLVSELVRGLRDDGSLRVVGGRAESTSDSVPATLASVVVREVDDLDRDAKGVVRLAAVLGTRFVLEELAAAAGREPSELMATIDTVVARGLLVDDGDHLAFRHDLVQGIVYDQIPQSVRVAVHRQVASTLAASGASSQRVALHYAAGAQPGDTVAVEALRAAAKELLSSAPTEALALIEHALALETRSEPRTRLLVDKMEALGLAGRVEEAEALGSELLHLARSPELRVVIQLDRASLLLLANRPADAADELEAIETDDVEQLTLARAEAALAALAAGQPERARADVEAALSTVDLDSPTVGASLALVVQSRLAMHEFDAAESARLSLLAVETADRVESDLAHRYQPLFFHAMTLHDLDRFDEVLQVASVGRAVADRDGHAFALPLYDGIEAFTHLRAGRVEDARRAAAAGVERCRQTGAALALAYNHALHAVALVHQDEVPLARQAVLEGQTALRDQLPLLGLDLILLADALVREAEGDHRGALDVLGGASDLFHDGLRLPHMAVTLGPATARLACRLGDEERAITTVLRLEAAGERLDLPGWRAPGFEARALFEGDVELMQAAAAAYAAAPRPLHAARAREQVGALLLAAEERTAAATELRTVVELFEGCGAVRDRARAAGALRSAGGRSVRSQPPSAHGVPGLSPKETEVVRLVGEGLTNPQVADRLFVSRRTVETHLRRIFGKLGVSSRVELALWAHHQEPSEAEPSP